MWIACRFHLPKIFKSCPVMPCLSSLNILISLQYPTVNTLTSVMAVPPHAQILPLFDSKKFPMTTDVRCCRFPKRTSLYPVSCDLADGLPLLLILLRPLKQPRRSPLNCCILILRRSRKNDPFDSGRAMEFLLRIPLGQRTSTQTIGRVDDYEASTSSQILSQDKAIHFEPLMNSLH